MTPPDARAGTNGTAGTAAPAELVFSSPRGRWVLVATVFGSGIALLDATVVGIALPSISRAFGGGVGTLQWVVTGYSLTLAAFLLLGGSLGDRFGRRRMFSIGIAWFAVASAACGLAPNAAFLIWRPRRPGHRRGAPDARQPRHHPGVVPPRRPLTGHRRVVRIRRCGHRRRSADRGLPAGGRAPGAGSSSSTSPSPSSCWSSRRATCPNRRDPTARGHIDVAGADARRSSSSPAHLRVDRGPDASGGRTRSSSSRWFSWRSAGPAFLVVERRIANPMLPLDLFRSANSAAPTPSPSSSTAHSVARCSCCRSSCRSSCTTARCSRGSPSCR